MKLKQSVMYPPLSSAFLFVNEFDRFNSVKKTSVIHSSFWMEVAVNQTSLEPVFREDGIRVFGLDAEIEKKVSCITLDSVPLIQISILTHNRCKEREMKS